MHTIRLAVIGIAAFSVWSSSTEAVEVVRPLADFSLIPATESANRMALSLTAAGASDSDIATLTGDLQGSLRLDVVGDQVEVTGLNFSGGEFALSNTSFDIRVVVFFLTVATVDADGIGLGGTIDTVPSFGAVASGQFNTIDHEVTINMGTVIAVGTGLASDLSQSIDLTATPLSITPDTSGTLALSLISTAGTTNNYRARISIPVDESVPIPDLPVAVTLAAMGNIVAEGYFSIDLGTPGDFNGDDVVDAADYTVWRDNLGGSEASLSFGSGDSSGSVDGGDYAIWRQQFGRSDGPSTPVGFAVPEPSAFLLFAFATACASGLRLGCYVAAPEIPLTA